MAIIGGTMQVSNVIELRQPLTLNGGTLKGGTVTQNGEARLFFAANAANTLDGVNVEGDLVLTNTGARTLIRNGLSLTGSVMLDNGGIISFVGNQTFATGSIVFAGNSGSLGIANGTTLTLGPAMVVRGKTGLIGASVFTMAPGNLINQGLISADVAGGTLTLNPTQFDNTGTVETRNGGSMTILLSGGGWRNAGVIDAGGGTLTLNGAWTNSATITANEATVNLGGAFALANFGTFNRTGGTVNVTGVLDLGGGTLALDAAAGSWQMNGGTLKGGTVTQSGGGNLLFAGGAVSTLDGVTLDGDLVLTNLSVRVLIRNGLALTGSVQLDNENAISFSGSQTFQTGQVVFAGNSGLLGIEPGTTLTLGPTVIVRGRSGRIGPSMFNFSGTRRLINQGLIAADVPSGTLTINPTEFENTGILRADGAGAMLVIRANPFTDTGTIEELNGGDVQINP
jgi:hypothetical protein